MRKENKHSTANWRWTNVPIVTEHGQDREGEALLNLATIIDRVKTVRMQYFTNRNQTHVVLTKTIVQPRRQWFHPGWLLVCMVKWNTPANSTRSCSTQTELWNKRAIQTILMLFKYWARTEQTMLTPFARVGPGRDSTNAIGLYSRNVNITRLSEV